MVTVRNLYGKAQGLYRELELNLRIKPKKRLVREKPEPLAMPEAINQIRSTGYVIDGLYRKGPGIEVDFPLPAERVIRALERIIEWRGRMSII